MTARDWTLLLSDLVESTRRTEVLGDAAWAALSARHDGMARALLRTHKGREIDKTDGFFLLFSEPADALDYALAYHAGLEALGLQARVGIHVAPILLRENAASDVAQGAKPLEVEGLAKPVAARVMALARPNQTLATQETIDALPATLSNGVVVLAHGHWQLKGVAQPMALFEVGVVGRSPLAPPPDGAKAWRVVWRGGAWLPLTAVEHRLPAPRDAFVGREGALHQLARCIDDGARLVSVLGIGGTGKTRLVVRFASTWLGDFPGGAWFCDLTEARTLEGIHAAVAHALGVPLGRDDPGTQLGSAIASRGRCLVLLDNFEQVARHATESLAQWLDWAPECVFVVTTREVLGLAGEQIIALPPLTPAEAVALFITRATSAKHDFSLSEAERTALESLVQMLDCLPLAIELAAARVRVMPPSVLLQRMSQRFKLLTSAGGRHTRQATLRGALDWSWDLLSGDEQAALAQLSTFSGGFTMEAAEAVVALDAMWSVDAVQSLLDKSLLRRVSDPRGDSVRMDSVRMDLLVSVQEYAAERLAASPHQTSAEVRHGRYFAGFGSDSALDALDAPGGVARHRALADERDNLEVACRRAVARRDGETAVATLSAAWIVLEFSGALSTGAALAALVRDGCDLPPALRAAALRTEAQALHSLGRVSEARVSYLEALDLSRAAGDRRCEQLLLGNLGDLARQGGDTAEASEWLDAKLAVARAMGDRRFEGHALGALGLLRQEQGDPEGALAYGEAALEIARSVGDRHSQGSWLANLAAVNRMLGRIEAARSRYDDALAIARELNNRRLETSIASGRGVLAMELGQDEVAARLLGDALAVARRSGDGRMAGHLENNLGYTHRSGGRFEAAWSCYQNAVERARAARDPWLETSALCNLGNVRLEQGRWEEAVAPYREGLACARRLADTRLTAVIVGNLGATDLAAGRLEAARLAFDEAEGIFRGGRHPNDLAVVLARQARLAWAEGRAEAAAAALAEAEAISLQLKSAPNTRLGRELALARAAASAV